MTLKTLSLSLFLALGLFQPLSYAAISLSITPIDGGTGIRFDRIIPGLKNTKQLQVRINSNTGKRYQVFQRVFEPITNEKGQQLNLSSIETATLPNSNSGGTLYLQNADHLTYSEQLIYTSGQGGESDAFGIIYSISPQSLGLGGYFRGRIVFTVRSLGAADQSESTVDFSLESMARLQVSVGGDHEARRVRIKDSDTSEERADFVKVSFANNGAQDIKFYQETVLFPSTDAGTELPSDVIRISVEGSGSNLRTNSSSLGHSRILLYSGVIDEDSFAVYFLVDPDKIQKAPAGIYKGQVKYIVEGGSNHQEFTMDVELTVQPLFTIDVTIPPEGINFGHVLASSPGQEKQLTVTVRTNLNKPYQVVQDMPSLMTNEHGKEFDKKYFTFKVDLTSDQKGHTKFGDFSPVEAGDYPIYYSDAQGSPVTFTVTYQLKGYFDMNPGNFVAPLKFSLNQN